MLEQTPNLPKSFQKIRVYKLTNDFEAATQIDNVNFQDLLSRLKTGQVIVKYDFVGINASDINFTAGRYDPTLKPPFDCGFEGLGTIVVRDGKSAYKLGQPVAVMSYGCFSEYQIVSERALIPLPSVQERFLPLLVSGLTSHLALKHHGRMKSGETGLKYTQYSSSHSNWKSNLGCCWGCGTNRSATSQTGRKSCDWDLLVWERGILEIYRV